jgi:hypothetical protein
MALTTSLSTEKMSEKGRPNRPSGQFGHSFHSPSGQNQPGALAEEGGEDAPICCCGIRMEKQWSEPFSAKKSDVGLRDFANRSPLRSD